jgi:hypothetical protein
MPRAKRITRDGVTVTFADEHLGYVVPVADPLLMSDPRGRVRGVPDAQLKRLGGRRGGAKIQRLEAKYQAHFGIGFEEAGRALKRSMGRAPRPTHPSSAWRSAGGSITAALTLSKASSRPAKSCFLVNLHLVRAWRAGSRPKRCSYSTPMTRMSDGSRPSSASPRWRPDG